MNKFLHWFLGVPNKYSKGPKKSISVLIPAYNESATIASTIKSIQHQTKVPEEIVVVDDCSKDNTGEIARNLGAKVIRLEKNSGTKAQAQNAGLYSIATDIVITIDADTILDKYAIENVIKPLSDSNIASVCGLVIPQRIQTIFEKSRFIEYLYGITLNKKAQQNTGAILVSSGCFSAFRTKELQSNGGFKNRTCAEDMDYTWARLIEGKRIVCQQNAVCYPLDPPNWRIYQNQVDRWYSAFFENISIYRKEIFHNLKLAGFVSWYLIEGLLAPLGWIGLVVMALQGTHIATVFLLVNLLLIVAVSVYAGIKVHKGWLTLTSIPCYLIMSFVNIYLFYKSFIKEWILNKKVVVWEKGH